MVLDNIETTSHNQQQANIINRVSNLDQVVFTIQELNDQTLKPSQISSGQYKLHIDRGLISQQPSLRFKSIIKFQYDRRLMKCIKSQDFASLPLISILFDKAGVTESFLFAHKILQTYGSSIDDRNEKISFAAKLSGYKFKDLIEVDNINSYTKLSKDKFMIEVSHWTEKPTGRYFSQPRRLYQDSVQLVLRQEFSKPQLSRQEQMQFAFDPQTYFSPGTMKGSMQQSKTQSILNQYSKHGKAYFKKQLFNLNYTKTQFYIFAKIEQKKMRPVCNIDETTFIQCQLLKKFLEQQVTAKWINHEMSLGKQLIWQKQYLDMINNTSNVNLFCSIDAKNFDQHQTITQILTILGQIQILSPNYSWLTESIIQRLRGAVINYFDYYDDDNKTTLWQNALPSGIPFTSLFGSISNLAQIIAASMDDPYRYEIPDIQHTLLDRGFIYDMKVNSDDTLIITQQNVIQRILKNFKDWGLEYHPTQIISTCQFEFLRTMYYQNDVYQYPMRLVSNIVWKNPMKHELSTQNQISKWQTQWQSLTSRCGYDSNIQNMANNDLYNLLKQKVSMANIKLITSNKFGPYFLGGNDNGKNIHLAVYNGLKDTKINDMLDNVRFTNDQMHELLTTTSPRLIALSYFSKSLNEQQQKLKLQDKNRNSIEKTLQFKIFSKSLSDVQMTFSRRALPRIKIELSVPIVNVSPLMFMNPGFTQQYYEFCRKQDLTPLQIIQKFIQLQPVYIQKTIYEQQIMKLVLPDIQWDNVRLLLGLFKTFQNSQIGSDRVWSYYYQTQFALQYRYRMAGGRIVNKINYLQQYIGLLRLVQLPPFSGYHYQTSS